MKLDLVAPYFRPVSGGIEDHVAALAVAAREVGHDVTVHTRDQDLVGQRLDAQATIDGIRVRRWPAVKSHGYYTTRFEPQLEGDFIHMHGYGTWTHDWVARRYAGRPMVMTLHHGLRIPTPGPIHALYHGLHRITRGRGTLRRMDRVVAVTPVDVERLDAMGYPPHKVALIPNGVPPEAFVSTTAEPPPDGWDAYFLFLGRLHKEKCADHAIRALHAVPRGTGLLLAGPDQGDGKRLAHLVNQEGLVHRVRFLGRVGQDRKRALLKGARALVLPSRYEAQGRVILEAWAQATPTVAARVGGVPFVIEDGRDGLLYDWGDTDQLASRLMTMCDEAAQAQRLGRVGREKARAEYLEPTLMKQTLKLYEDVRASRSA